MKIVQNMRSSNLSYFPLQFSSVSDLKKHYYRLQKHNIMNQKQALENGTGVSFGLNANFSVEGSSLRSRKDANKPIFTNNVMLGMLRGTPENIMSLSVARLCKE